MRFCLATMTVLLVIAMDDPAFALQPNDTMHAWGQAPRAERGALVKRLLGTGGGDAVGVGKCLDAASEVTGHADLEIGQVAKACASAKDDGDPV